MERRILIFTFISIIVTNLQGQWEVLREGYPGHINDIDFVSDEVGWLNSHYWLVKTVDGGETWQNVQIPENIYFDKIDFSSDSIGWAFATPDSNREDNHIYKTADGGLSWQAVYNLSVENIWGQNICALNDSVVYTLLNSNFKDFILKTTDGGENWNDISIDLQNKYPYEIQPISSNVALVLARNSSSSVLRTTNGGDSWEETILPNFTIDDDVYDLQVVNDSLAYFLVEKNNNYTDWFIYASTDTGKTWTIKTQRSDPIDSYFAVDEKTVFALMQDSIYTSVMKSIDGGLSWEKGLSFFRGGDKKLYFNQNNDGFIINNSGWRTYTSSLLKSSDFGETWNLRYFNYPLSSIYVIDRNRAFAYAYFLHGLHDGESVGDLYFTNDGGKTWESKFSMSGRLKKVFLINETVGFGVGFSTFIKTTDGGNNWTKLSELTDGFIPQDMSFLDEQTGWIAGKVYNNSRDSSSAAVLLTNDGGENWERVWKSETKKSSYSYGLKSIYFANSVIWTVGESGLIVKSVHPGSFQVIAAETDLPLNDVYFSDEDHGWIAGGYFNYSDFQSILLKTINAGQTWSEIRFDKWLINDMHFTDSLHGWAVGSDTSFNGGGPWQKKGKGVILYTVNGGESWTTQVEGLKTPLNALHFKDGVGWAVGENGLVLRTDDGSTWINQNSGKTYRNKFSLSQNYPNPFNPITVISYQLLKTSKVNLSIYNVLGQKAATLVSEKQPAGTYNVQWDASDCANGVYLYRLKTDGGYEEVKKLVLIK